MTRVRMVPSDELRPEEIAALRSVFDDAFGSGIDAFSDEDWDHALGGLHFILEDGATPVAHASVVERELQTGGHGLTTGYVEAVATAPAHQGCGYGTAVMEEVDDHIDRTFQLGALGTGRSTFYGRLGWVTWKGPTFVRTETGLVHTADEDGYVMVRLTPASPELDLSAPISCDWRAGDVW